MTLDVARVSASRNLRNYVERTFRHMAEAKQLGFYGRARPRSLPPAMMTDTTRLQQILKNLLSNAFKFTAHGQVALHDRRWSTSGWTPDHPTCSQRRRGAGVLGHATPASASRPTSCS